ncbi:MAG: FecR domain-containing protein [Spirochaetia bacterium]
MRKLAVVAVFLILASAICFAQKGQPGARIPTVTYLEGTVTIDGVVASIGDTVPLGSVLTTAAGSLVDIEFNTRNAIRLSENTTLVFNPNNLQIGSELRQGALTLVLKQLTVGATGQGFLVRAPSATAGVRGTSFFMKVESPTSTYVCSCNGEVQVFGRDGTLERDLAANHHKAIHIDTSSGGAPRIIDAPRLYHTDADLEGVAAAIGFTIDWNVIDH